MGNFMVGRYCIVGWKFNFNLYTLVLKVSIYIGSPESRVFILVALARVNASNWFNIMTRLASFYRE